MNPEFGVVPFGGVFIVDLLGPTLWTGSGKNNVFHVAGKNRHGIVILRVSRRFRFGLLGCAENLTASFAAMKAVEVAAREVASLPNEILGVNLMRKAFSPKDGILRDLDAEKGEQQAFADLFAGAIGAFKTPASHRTVKSEDSLETAEVHPISRSTPTDYRLSI